MYMTHAYKLTIYIILHIYIYSTYIYIYSTYIYIQYIYIYTVHIYIYIQYIYIYTVHIYIYSTYIYTVHIYIYIYIHLNNEKHTNRPSDIHPHTEVPLRPVRPCFSRMKLFCWEQSTHSGIYNPQSCAVL